MEGKITALNLVNAILGITVFAIGVLNVLLVHAIPGVIFILFSFLYLPRANPVIQKKFGVKIPSMVKILLGIVLIWFTLGISDLGDMID